MKFQEHVRQVSSRACVKFQEHVRQVSSRACVTFQEHVRSVAPRACVKFQEHVRQVSSRACRKFQEPVRSVAPRAWVKILKKEETKKRATSTLLHPSHPNPPQPPPNPLQPPQPPTQKRCLRLQRSCSETKHEARKMSKIKCQKSHKTTRGSTKNVKNHIKPHGGLGVVVQLHTQKKHRLSIDFPSNYSISTHVSITTSICFY